MSAWARRNGKLLGLVALLALVVAVAWANSPNFLSGRNVTNLLFRTSLYGILSLGAAFVIVTGGIDLSIGSMVCLVGLGLPMLAVDAGWPMGLALPAVLALAVALGLMHGLLVTRLNLQPFIVTLCGLLLYRGLARWWTGDASVGFGMEEVAIRGLVRARWEIAGDLALQGPMVVVLVLTAAAFVFFDRTIWGRYLLALGRNREAARLSGIPTDRMTLVAYAVCALLAGCGGILFVLDTGGGKAANMGNFYELYAIAGAVLGGCSLRGGEVSVVGVVLGAGLMQVLRSAIVQMDLATELEFAVVGGVILVWVVVEEILRRVLGRGAT